MVGHELPELSHQDFSFSPLGSSKVSERGVYHLCCKLCWPTTRTIAREAGARLTRFFARHLDNPNNVREKFPEVTLPLLSNCAHLRLLGTILSSANYKVYWTKLRRVPKRAWAFSKVVLFLPPPPPLGAQEVYISPMLRTLKTCTKKWTVGCRALDKTFSPSYYCICI